MRTQGQVPKKRMQNILIPIPLITIFLFYNYKFKYLLIPTRL